MRGAGEARMRGGLAELAHTAQAPVQRGHGGCVSVASLRVSPTPPHNLDSALRGMPARRPCRAG